MKRVLIIAGNRYTGSHQTPHLTHHLARQLVDLGRKVPVLGDFPLPWFSMPPSVEYVVEDYSKKEIVALLLDSHQEVIYLAYEQQVSSTFENASEALLRNLPATVQMFTEVAQRGRKMVFFSSGSAVYGEAVNIPISEIHPTRPLSEYGVTKLTLENFARLFSVTMGLKCICVRPSNVYGDGQRPLEGQGFISVAIESVLRRIPIKLFGSSDIIRDYIYVGDLASGIVSALESGEVSEIYNIGTGVGLSNLEVIEAIRLLMVNTGYEVLVKDFPARALDVKSNVLCSKKIYNQTGWKSKTSFKDGLVTTLNWMIKQHR